MEQKLGGHCLACHREVILLATTTDDKRIAWAQTECPCGRTGVTVYPIYATPVTDSIKVVPLGMTYKPSTTVQHFVAQGESPEFGDRHYEVRPETPVTSAPPPPPYASAWEELAERLGVRLTPADQYHLRTLDDLVSRLAFVVTLHDRDETERGFAKAAAFRGPLIDEQAAKTPHDPATLAESVGLVVKLAQDRVGPDSIGAQQCWKEGEPQAFEYMALDKLIEYAEEEALDAINYSVMQVLRFRRLKGDLATRELFIECPTCYGNRKMVDCGTCYNEGYIPLLAPGK